MSSPPLSHNETQRLQRRSARGPGSGQHVDLLGNSEMILDVLAVASVSGRLAHAQTSRCTSERLTALDWTRASLLTSFSHLRVTARSCRMTCTRTSPASHRASIFETKKKYDCELSCCFKLILSKFHHQHQRLIQRNQYRKTTVFNKAETA